MARAPRKKHQNDHRPKPPPPPWYSKEYFDSIPRLKSMTAEETRDAISKYFDFCEETDRPANIAGLALTLGYAGTNGLHQAMHSDSMDQTRLTIVQSAKSVIEEGHSARIAGGKINPAGAMFLLKCQHNYTETQPAQQVNFNISWQQPDSLAPIDVTPNQMLTIPEGYNDVRPKKERVNAKRKGKDKG